MAPEMVPDIGPDTASLSLCASPRANRPQRLKQRADFLAAATSGIKAPAKGLVLQVRARPDSDAIRFGFTVSKRVGNAVERNRVRRRLREVVRLTAAGCLLPGHDYVLIGRRAALEVPFARLVEDFKSVLSRIARGRTADTARASNQSVSKPGSMAPTR